MRKFFLAAAATVVLGVPAFGADDRGVTDKEIHDVVEYVPISALRNDGIEELNRESFGGVEDDLEIVGLIAVAAFNSEASLLANRVR